MAILTVSVGPLQVFSVLGRNVYFWLGCLWFGCRAGRAALFSSYLGHLCVCLDNLHWGCFVIFNLSWKAACPTQPLEVNTRGGAPSRRQRWLMTSAGGPGEAAVSGSCACGPSSPQPHRQGWLQSRGGRSLIHAAVGTGLKCFLLLIFIVSPFCWKALRIMYSGLSDSQILGEDYKDGQAV